MTFIPSPINPTTTEAKPSPFIAFTQRVIPATFDQSLSYQEALYALLNFLQKEVVPTINANAEVTEQQTKVIEDLVKYVNEYFDNLDVQEEINNKLDAMAEDGTLAEIVTAYLNVKAILAYDTISAMSSATNIIEGSFLAVYGLNALNDHVLTFYKARQIRNTDVVDGINIVALSDENLVAEIMTNPLISSFATVADMVEANLLSEQTVRTLGYYSVGDGGGADYVISSTAGDVAIELDNGLYANLIINEVNLMQFGCHGDGTTDDTTTLQSAITYAKANNKKITSPSGKSYLTTETLDLTRINVDLNNSILKSNSAISIITINDAVEHKANINYYHNITIEGNDTSNGINIINGHRNEFESINIKSCIISVRIQAGFENNFSNVNINATNSTSSIGFQVETPDCMINSGTSVNANIAFNLIGSVLINISNFHAWPYGASVENSKFIQANGECRAYVNNSIIDSYQYGFYLISPGANAIQPGIQFVNCEFEWANDVFTNHPEYGNPYVFYLGLNNKHETPGCSIIGCRFYGSSVSGFNTKFVPDNVNYWGIFDDSRTVRVDNISNYYRTSLQVGSSVVNIIKNYIVKDRNTVTIEILGTFAGNSPADTVILGIVPERFRPLDSSYKGVCFVADDSWNDKSMEACTAQVITSSGQLQVNIPNNNNSATRYLRLSMTYPN